MESTEVSFTAKDVMALRQKTGLGMMDCKKALTECNGSMEAAEEWLRHQLKGKMDARTERPAAEGRIAISIEGDQAAIIEVRAETDFTARNEQFQAMVSELAGMALSRSAGAVQADDAMTARVDDVRISTGENISFARGEKLEGGGFGGYVHHDGKRAALVQIEGTADEDLLRGICQHIVAHVPPPLGVTEQDVPADAMDKVRAEAQQEAAESGKPAEIVEKIAEGKVRKYLQQNTLLNQMYVKDPAGKTPVKKVLPKDVTVKRFVRYTVGAD
ncbi:MAG: translation elongation factor Ts [Planctomycetota bacterium]|jgi:elongation factor Ts